MRRRDEVVTSTCLLAVFIFVSGCASTQSIPASERSRTYTPAKDTVITAVVETFTNQGYTIETIDRATGIVSTGRKSNPSLEAALVGDLSRKVQARVTSSEDGGSKVVLTLVYQRENAFGNRQAQSVGKSAAMDMYDELFSLIESRL